MPNINLLEGKDYTRDIEKIESDSVSFQDIQEETEPKEDLTEPVQVEEEVIKSEPEEPSSSYRRYSSPWPVIVGVAGVLIIILLFVYFKYFKGSDTTTKQEPPVVDSTAVVASSDTTRTPTQQPSEPEAVTDQIEDEPSQRRPVDPGVTKAIGTLSESRKSAAVGASLLADFLSSFPSGMRLSFFRFGGRTYSAEIAAQSAGLFSQFALNISQKNRAVQINLVSENEVYTGDRVMIVRQITGELPLTGTSPGATNSITSNRVQSELNATVTKHGLRIRELDISPLISSGNYNIRLTTLKVYGNQERLSTFIQDMLNTYNNIGINKMMISVPSSADLLDNQMMATLDLDIYLD